jgi:hypothetical protein
MNDARFKELLNLHLDQRLSVAEAQELEEMLRADTSRRKALRDYEAMQSACATLFARTEASAPSSEALRRALRAAEARIERPGAQRDPWGWPTWGLTGSLAACVALLVARLSQPAVGVAETSPGAGSPGTSSSVAAAFDSGDLGAGAIARAESPRHLTFAALGLNPEGANADTVSRWILEVDEPAMFATLDEAIAASESMPSWRPAATVPVASSHFSGRPISVWARQSMTGGFQVEPAGFRFER